MTLKNKILLAILLIILIGVFLYCYYVLKYESPIVKYSHIYYRQNSNNSWVILEQTFSPEYYKTKDAIRIGDNLLFYQNENGGWSKNICMQSRINIFDKLYFKHKEDLWEATIDNDATVTEIDFLSKLYNATGKKKYKKAVNKGLLYLLASQYRNGGFPQKTDSAKEKYQRQITYNDKAMVNVMLLLKKIIDNDEQYNFIDSKTRERVRYAYEQGIECILETQLPSGMWSAQYDKSLLIPCYARKYEPPTIDTRESAEIVMFLMSIKNPDERIINAITKSVLWFDKKAIKNKNIKPLLKNGKYYLKLVDCATCSPIWARDYDIEKEVPVFSDRTQKIKFDISEIDAERMFTYEWYVNLGNKVLDEYKIWKQKYVK